MPAGNPVQRRILCLATLTLAAAVDAIDQPAAQCKSPLVFLLFPQWPARLFLPMKTSTRYSVSAKSEATLREKAEVNMESLRSLAHRWNRFRHA
jgi:hypothetical protein